MEWKCLTAVCCDADKQSGVVLRAPFLSTVLQQVIIALLPCLIKGAAVSHLAGASAGPRVLSIISAFLFEYEHLAEGYYSGMHMGALQPFYSTERITQLVKDVEQHLNTLLVDEPGAPSHSAQIPF